MEQLYGTAKLPFHYNYVDGDLDVTHDNDDQGEHGSHVAGIATANRYIKTEDGFVSALEAVKVQGVAPDAQLITMKVFGKSGGAYDSDYMAAIEDAILLGVRRGEPVSGFTPIPAILTAKPTRASWSS
ncbi:MAG: S8 family serine peptidase [Oscillospiraceae bacterium]